MRMRDQISLWFLLRLSPSVPIRPPHRPTSAHLASAWAVPPFWGDFLSLSLPSQTLAFCKTLAMHFLFTEPCPAHTDQGRLSFWAAPGNSTVWTVLQTFINMSLPLKSYRVLKKMTLRLHLPQLLISSFLQPSNTIKFLLCFSSQRHLLFLGKIYWVDQ